MYSPTPSAADDELVPVNFANTPLFFIPRWATSEEVLMSTFDKGVSAEKDLDQWVVNIAQDYAGKGLAMHWGVLHLILKKKKYGHIHNVTKNTTYLGNILRFTAAFLRHGRQLKFLDMATRIPLTYIDTCPTAFTQDDKKMDRLVALIFSILQQDTSVRILRRDFNPKLKGGDEGLKLLERVESAMKMEWLDRARRLRAQVEINEKLASIQHKPIFELSADDKAFLSSVPSETAEDEGQRGAVAEARVAELQRLLQEQQDKYALLESRLEESEEKCWKMQQQLKRKRKSEKSDEEYKDKGEDDDEDEDGESQGEEDEGEDEHEGEGEGEDEGEGEEDNGKGGEGEQESPTKKQKTERRVTRSIK